MTSTIKIRCPKCGKEEVLDLSSSQDIYVTGLKNFSFIHEDHILTVYVDANGFIRGAYIKPIHYASDNNCFFNGYLVLTRVIIGHDFRFVTLWRKKRIIDIRAFPELITNIYYFLNALLNDSLDRALIDYKIIKECAKDVCIYGLELNRNTKKWLKLVLTALLKGHIPSENQLKKLLIYLDKNKEKEPSKADLDYILGILNEKN